MMRVALVAAGALALTALSVPSPAAAAPAPPTITQPKGGEIYCNQFWADLLGTAAPGTQVRVGVNDHEVGDAVQPTREDGVWWAHVYLDKGANDIWAVAQDDTGTSERSTPVRVSYEDYVSNPAVSTWIFSPRRRDGELDRVTASVEVGGEGTVTWQVRPTKGFPDEPGQPVRTTAPVTATAGQTLTWDWAGRDDEGAFVPSGRYVVRAVWNGAAGTCYVDDEVQVDNDPPRVERMWTDYRTFYPRRGDAIRGWRDLAIVHGGQLSEGGAAWLQVFRHGGVTPLKTQKEGLTISGETMDASWDGRRRDGTLQPEGVYDLRFRMRDHWGNVGFTPRVAVTLSHQRLVAHTVTVRKAAAYVSSVADPRGCDATVSRARSGYAGGLRISYACTAGSGPRPVVNWLFSAPRAAAYLQFRPFVYGRAAQEDSPGLPLGTVDYAHGSLLGLGTAGPAEQRHWLTAVGGSGFLSPTRNFRLLATTTPAGRVDYDLRTVGVTITYGTLTH